MRQIIRQIITEGDVLYYDVEDAVENFGDILRQLYEIEYKYHATNTMNFKGHPKRLANILKRYNTIALKHVKAVGGVLFEVYNEWLKQHAITSPKDWSSYRESEFFQDVEGDVYDVNYYAAAVLEWGHYARPDLDIKYTREIIALIPQMIKSTQALANDEMFMRILPATARLLEPITREINRDTSSSNKYNPFKALYDPPSNRIRGVAETAISLGTGHPLSWEDAIQISNVDNIRDTVEEWFRVCTFPIWFSTWKKYGIVETRDKMVKVVGELQEIINTNEFDPSMFARLNHIINVTHQTGSMIEYVEEYTYDGGLTDLLDELSTIDVEQIEEWKDELKELGFAENEGMDNRTYYNQLLQASIKKIRQIKTLLSHKSLQESLPYTRF